MQATEEHSMKTGNILRSVRNISWVALCLLLMSPSAIAGALEEVTVFEQGEDNYHTYRIPAIVRDNNGTLLAFAEDDRQ